jgi:hypothetical protein
LQEGSSIYLLHGVLHRCALLEGFFVAIVFASLVSPQQGGRQTETHTLHGRFSF